MSHDHHLQKIAQSAGMLTVGMVLGGFLNYLSRMVVARWLGSSAYGLLSLAIAVTGLVAVISLFGLSQGLTRYIPYYKARDDFEKLNGAIFTSFKTSLPASLILSGLVFWFATDLAATIFAKPELAPVLRTFALIIPAKVLLDLLQSCFRGFKRSKFRVYTADMFLPAVRLALIFAFVVLGFGLLGASLAYVIATFLTAGITFYLVENYVFSLFEDKKGVESKTRELFAFSWPMMLVGIFASILNRVDVLILGAFQSASEVGIYNVALPTSGLLIWIFGTFNYLLRPTVSDLFSQGNLKQIGRVYRQVTRWVFILSLPLLLLMVVFPSTALSILFGAEYGAGGLALAILVSGYFIYSLAGTAHSILVALGNTRQVMLVSLLTLISNVLLNLLLVPLYGMEGAAVALTASFIIGSTLAILLAYREAKLHPFSWQLVKSFLPLFIFLPLLLLVKQTITPNLSNLAIIVPTFLAAYLILVKITKILTEEDMEIIKSLLMKRT